MKHFSDDETTKHKSANKKMWPHLCLLLLIFCTNASSSDTEADETVGEKIFRKIGEWWTVGLSMGMTNSAWIWQIEQLEWIGRGQLNIFWQKRLIETEMQSFPPFERAVENLDNVEFQFEFYLETNISLRIEGECNKRYSIPPQFFLTLY